MTDLPGRNCRNRLFEWTMTAALIGIAIELIIWPDAFAKSKLQFVLDIIGSGALTVFILMTGFLRATALFLNGGWPIYGAHLRAVCAIGGMLVWLQMGISLIITQLAIVGPPSPSVPLYFALAAAELYSTYRAAADARFR